MFNTNNEYIDKATELKADAPDLAEKVWKGEMKIPQAHRALRARDPKPAPPKRRAKKYPTEMKRTVLGELLYWWGKASLDERARFREHIENEGKPPSLALLHAKQRAE